MSWCYLVDPFRICFRPGSDLSADPTQVQQVVCEFSETENLGDRLRLAAALELWGLILDEDADPACRDFGPLDIHAVLTQARSVTRDGYDVWNIYLVSGAFQDAKAHGILDVCLDNGVGHLFIGGEVWLDLQPLMEAAVVVDCVPRKINQWPTSA